MIKVTYLNNDGGGFARESEVVDGTTIQEFLEDKMTLSAADRGTETMFSPAGYSIRVNNSIKRSNYVLQNGDFVTATPTNIKGN